MSYAVKTLAIPSRMHVILGDWWSELFIQNPPNKLRKESFTFWEFLNLNELIFGMRLMNRARADADRG